RHGTAALSADCACDGSLRLTVQAGTAARSVPPLQEALRSCGVWDTDPATAHWALGASAGLDGALLNSGTGTVSFGVVDGAEFFVFASDFGPAAFTTGSGFSLTVTLADGSVATVQTTIP